MMNCLKVFSYEFGIFTDGTGFGLGGGLTEVVADALPLSVDAYLAHQGGING